MVPVGIGRARKRVVVALSFGAFATIAVGLGWLVSPAAAQSPSDSRARFVEGNVTTCAGIGLPSDVQVGSASSTNARDAHVEGTVKSNAGTTHSGQGQELDVATTGSGVVVDAIVVKGGPAYNLYSDPSVLPPTLRPDQHYISPFNGGGNVPTISHWFVCYRLGPPPTTTTTTTTIATTTTVAAPTTSLSSPPVTSHPAGSTVASTATTSTTAAKVVSSKRALIRPIPKASTTTQPTVAPAVSTLPTTSVAMTITAAPAAQTESGRSTASLVIGGAIAIVGLGLLAIRPRP
jgi:hypothetical protein